MPDKISVIIPTFNEEDVIGDCVDSLKQQSYKNFEIIIVDDGSTDKTVNLVKNIDLVKLLRQSHKGPGSARNFGASKSKGEILVFVDADMTFDKEFISELTKPIRDGKTNGTFSRHEYVSNSDKIYARCWSINQKWEEGRMHPNSIADTQKVFRAILRREFEKAGGFSLGGHYTDDWSLSEKLGYEATLVEGAMFYHKNPETLKEVFYQAKWAAKRKYKLGVLGYIVALARASLPVSIVVGVYKSYRNNFIHFFPFKIVYDFGVFLGILEYVFLKKGSK